MKRSAITVWLRWEADAESGPFAVTGSDAAQLIDVQIARLWVLLNTPAN